MGEQGLKTVVWGGTSSVIASAQPVPGEGADLLVLDFGAADRDLDPTLRRQSFEGCLRQALSLPSRPRVVCLPGSEEQRILAEHYGVPPSTEAAWAAPSACSDPPQPCLTRSIPPTGSSPACGTPRPRPTPSRCSG